MNIFEMKKRAELYAVSIGLSEGESGLILVSPGGDCLYCEKEREAKAVSREMEGSRVFRVSVTPENEIKTTLA